MRPAIGSANKQEQAIVVLVCYLDDSGEKGEPVITMAGYLSFLPEWEAFEEKARHYFSENSITYLHTVDFHHGRGEFEDWCRKDRRDFINGLYDIFSQHCGLGIEFSVLKVVYKQRQQEQKPKRRLSPLAFCFGGIIDQLVKDQAVSELLKIPSIDLSFVVESGHTNNNDVLDLFNRHKIHPNGHIFNSISFADKKSLIALQMADFIAYYTRRFRVGQSTRRETEMEMFVSVTKDVRNLYFFATDFGLL